MMELSHSLTLNEEALAQIAEAKRPVFVFEWLRFLDKVLVAAQKSDIKGCQKKLVEQLTAQIHNSPGPPTRQLIGRCLATLFSVGDTFLLFETVNKCNDILRNKDDSPSFLSTKLAAITCIGAMYKKLSRMMGRSYEETVQILLKCLRNMESQARCEIMVTMEKICIGMENCIGSVVKEIYKAARHCLMDRTMAVRCAAAKCLLQMMKHTTFLYTTELESLASLCFRAFEGSNYDVRCTVGRLLGVVMATTQQAPKTAGKIRNVSLEEVLGIMMTGFLKGGIGFLKGGAGEMIKGTSGVSREIRVGVTHAYVTFVQTLGGLWLERNLPAFLHHVLELAANPKASSTHVDAVYSRKCVSFVFRSVGRMLSEKAQVAACRDFCQIIYQQMNSQDMALDAGGSTDLLYSQHGLICALQELGCLIQSLGTVSASLLTEAAGGAGLNDTVCSVLLHPAPAARLAAAWCLRCTCVALPSQLTPLLDRGTERLESLKTSAEAIGGYSAALAALVGATRQCPLGIPHARGKVLFNIAEDLLRSASQNSRLSLQRTQAGWLIIGSIMTLGSPVVRGVLPRMLLLWRISFPRSTKELESEKARGDAFTWQVTLEGRAGALGAIHSFLASCSDLVTPDVIRRILQPIEAALAMLTSISGIIKSYGQHLKATAAMLRLRLYEALSLLPPQSFEGNYNLLLRLLVAEFTLTENQANTTTSLLRAVCHADDSVILGSWLQETDHKSIEDQMEPNRKLDKDNLQPNSASGSGALEHDIASLYRSPPSGDAVPGPLPLGVAVIDASVALFGLIFPRVARKHRLQMLEHFTECIRQSKSVRQEAVQINVFTAVLGGMKGLAETKTNFGQDDVRKAAVTLIIGALTNANPILRCAAGEALGRMAQVVGDSRFVAEVTQNSFDRLKSARDVVSRTGHSLALGCVHRYVGGMGSGQHLNTSVSILLALAQDASSPVVQAWALHALALIADSGGPMFRSYVEPTLSLSLRLLLNVPVAHVDVLQCIGKCLSALITTIGPELHGNTNSVCTARSSFLCACAIMQEHHDPLVQAEATACLQQLHMFAPRHVNLSSLVPTLCKTLTSSHLLLRRAAVSCLRQLAQREAKEVCEHALTLASEGASGGQVPFGAIRKTKGAVSATSDGAGQTETGLPGVLFGMLDTETDRQLVSDIHDTLTSMLQAMAEDNLSQWLSLCKEVLTSSAEASGPPPVTIKDTETGDAEPDVSDSSEFKASEAPSTHPTIVPRWPTRVFAAASVRRIVAACEGNRAHLDLALARQLQSERHTSDYLVLHLSDVVRMAFMAATSDSDPLRLEGLETLQLIIDRFATVPEPEFPGHVILEQYQAQVGAALRPAFSPDTPSHVTAMACQVCSAWIGSGVARDLNDLRRVHQLLVSSLAKLKKGSNSSQLYNESTATLEKLAILKAWAEVYVIAMTQDEARQKAAGKELTQRSPQDDSTDDASSYGSRESLLDLVGPELPSLSRNWLDALRDHAILSLTPELTNQRHENGAFYSVDTMDLSRVHYRNSWTSILHAATLWLNGGGFEAGQQQEEGKTDDASASNEDNMERRMAPDGSANGSSTEESSVDQFYLVFGICMEALCSPRATEPLECVVICLQAMYKLLDSAWARDHIGSDRLLSVELCNVLHRLLLTRENPSAQLKVMDVVRQVVLATRESLVSRKKKKLKEIAPANQEPKSPDETALLGEGGEDGVMTPGQSVVFAILEVCLCVLVRHLPTLNPPTQPQANPRGAPAPLTRDGSALVAAALGTMADLPELCSPAGSVAILPTVLFLTTGVLREVSARCPADDPFGGDGGSGVAAEPMASALHALKQLASNPYTRDPRCCEQWTGLLRSALAKVLDISKTSSDRERVDEVSMILAVAIFIVSAPSDVVAVPNLQYPCLNLFKQALQSDDLQVRLKTVQTLRSVFLHPDRTVSIPYVHALSTKIIEHLGGREARQPSTDFQLNYTIECLHTFEVVISLAEAQHRIHILSLAIPILVMLLQEQDVLGGASRLSTTVHDNSLQRLMKIGLQYSTEFRTVVAAVPQLRTKLEAAIKAGPIAARRQHQNGANSDANGAGNNQGLGAPASAGVRAPSIKLKTDFSNFTG